MERRIYKMWVEPTADRKGIQSVKESNLNQRSVYWLKHDVWEDSIYHDCAYESTVRLWLK